MRFRLAVGLSFLGLLGPCAASAAGLPIQPVHIAAKDRHHTVDVTYFRTGHKAIDTALARYAQASVADFRHQKPDTKTADWRFSLFIRYDIERNDGGMLGVVFTTALNIGGAHGSIGLDTFNFRLPDGKQIALRDVLDLPRAIPRLSALAIPALIERQQAEDDAARRDWIVLGAGPKADNFGHVIVQRDALHVWFAPYEVASFAQGPQDVTIPLAGLEDVMTPHWRKTRVSGKSP